MVDTVLLGSPSFFSVIVTVKSLVTILEVHNFNKVQYQFLVIYPIPRSWKYSTLSSRNFTVLLTIRSAIHLESIFVHEKGTEFYFFLLWISNWQHIVCWRVYFCPHCSAALYLSSIECWYMCGSICEVSLLFHWVNCHSCTSMYCLNCCDFAINLDIGYSNSAF